jgi:hypothetical protein
MNNEEMIVTTKSLRVELDAALQKIKSLRSVARSQMLDTPDREVFSSFHEAVEQMTISIHDLEGSIMRLGMVLKAVGNANPYPNSYNPNNTIVEPTADGLKL